MHELGIVEEIFHVIEREMKQAASARVRAVSLKVGSLSEIPPDHLRELCRLYSQGTFADGMEIAIESVPAQAECLGCGRVFQPDSPVIQCADCGSYRCNLLSGKEIILDAVEVDAPSVSGTER
jgi:hydrogenase nickel incorporation protein HypA/HybF